MKYCLDLQDNNPSFGLFDRNINFMPDQHARKYVKNKEIFRSKKIEMRIFP